jgi:hypothetical protein
MLLSDQENRFSDHDEWRGVNVESGRQLTKLFAKKFVFVDSSGKDGIDK